MHSDGVGLIFNDCSDKVTKRRIIPEANSSWDFFNELEPFVCETDVLFNATKQIPLFLFIIAKQIMFFLAVSICISESILPTNA